jgi:hypothetical protein
MSSLTTTPLYCEECQPESTDTSVSSENVGKPIECKAAVAMAAKEPLQGKVLFFFFIFTDN